MRITRLVLSAAAYLSLPLPARKVKARDDRPDVAVRARDSNI